VLSDAKDGKLVLEGSENRGLYFQSLRGDSHVFIMKWPVRNWISTLPLTFLLKMISGDDVGGDGE